MPSQFDACEFDEMDAGRMYCAKQHLLFDTVRHPDGAGDDAHGEGGIAFARMHQQVGVDVIPAVDPEVVAELVTGPGGIIE